MGGGCAPCDPPPRGEVKRTRGHRSPQERLENIALIETCFSVAIDVKQVSFVNFLPFHRRVSPDAKLVTLRM